jgi:hypothetical protein
MKIWKIEAYIESEDDVSRKEIIKQINYNLNRGDGLCLDTDDGAFKLKLIKKVKDSEFEL